MFEIAEIDRAIFEAIRKEIVRIGYLPNIEDYSTAEAWQTARDTLRQSVLGNCLIDVYGVGSADDREEMTGAKITIDRKNENLGTVGGGGYQYTETQTGFTKIVIPQNSIHFEYEIRIDVNVIDIDFNSFTTQFERLMSNIIYSVFGQRCYLAATLVGGAADNSRKFFFEFSQKIDLSSLHFISKVITFHAKDIFLHIDTGLNAMNIVPINTINFYVSNSNLTEIYDI